MEWCGAEDGISGDKKSGTYFVENLKIDIVLDHLVTYGATWKFGVWFLSVDQDVVMKNRVFWGNFATDLRSLFSLGDDNRIISLMTIFEVYRMFSHIC